MFYVRKEKDYDGIKFYLSTMGKNSWWVSHDYRNSQMMLKSFKKYSDALKFYNSVEKRYEVITHLSLIHI